MKDNKQRIEELQKKNKKYNTIFSLIISLGLSITIAPSAVILEAFSGILMTALAYGILIGGMMGLLAALIIYTNKIEKNKKEIAHIKITESAKYLTNDEIELAKAVSKAKETLITTESLSTFLNSSEELKIVNDATYNDKVISFIKQMEEEKTIEFLQFYNRGEFNIENYSEQYNKPKQKIKSIRR